MGITTFPKAAVVGLCWLGILGVAGPPAYAQFAPVRTYYAGSLLQNVVLGDVNGDGRPDVVAAAGLGSVVCLLGQAGGFAAPQDYQISVNQTTRAARVADVTGDGRPDIVALDPNNSIVAVLPGQVGGFGSATSYRATGFAGRPVDLAVGDVNADGRPDLVVANSLAGIPSEVGVLLGQPGGFAPVVTYPVGLGTLYALTLGDVNADGRPDVVATGPSRMEVLLGQPGGTFGASTAYLTGGIMREVTLADVNADGRIDVVGCLGSANTVGIMLATGSGGYTAMTVPAGNQLVALAVGDVNADGRLDIVTANTDDDAVALVLGQAGGTFAAPQLYATGSGSRPRGVALADIDADGRLDIVTAHANDSIGVLRSTRALTATHARPAEQVVLYPNPAHQTATLRLPAVPGLPAATVTLHDPLGRVVRTQLVPGAAGTVPLALQGLKPGIYAVRVQAGAWQAVRQLTIE